MATERIQIVPPASFDPNNKQHLDIVLAEIGKTAHGTGWVMQSFDPESRKITLTRQSAVTQVTKTKGKRDSYEVGLSQGTKGTDGDAIAAKLESDPQHAGYIMTVFEPFRGRATLAKMTTGAQRCREAVATVFRVKPWDIQVADRPDGGFHIKLHRVYVASSHDDKLLEVAETVVGREGWFIQTNPQELTMEIVPSDPPTFPGVIPFDFNAPIKKFVAGSNDWAKIPLGIKLGAPGEDVGQQFYIDLEAAPHAQVSGTSGSGKTVTLHAFVAGVLARGAELIIVDTMEKKVDFMPFLPWIRQSGWGCESLEAATTAMGLAYDEGKRRAKLIGEHGVTKWSELPSDLGIRPLVIIVDEVTGLFFPEKVPKLPKDHPLVEEANYINALKAQLEAFCKKIAAEMRFAGLRLVLSSQVSSTNTGVDTSLRMNLANKMLLGSTPTAGNRNLSLSDAARVPKVPGNVQKDPAAARGVGVAEFEGQEPCVFKSSYASVDNYVAWLHSIGVPKTVGQEPTPQQIARFSGTMVRDDEPPSRMREEYGGFKDTPAPRREDGLSGAAAAGHDLKVAQAELNARLKSQ